MKRFISILVALVLVLVCGMQIAAYVGDIVSPCYEVCPDSPDGHHDFSEIYTITEYEDAGPFIHKICVIKREMCIYCGKPGVQTDHYHESESHSAGSNGYCVCGRHESTFQHD